jgi:hypothetical protein
LGQRTNVIDKTMHHIGVAWGSIFLSSWKTGYIIVGLGNSQKEVTVNGGGS